MPSSDSFVDLDARFKTIDLDAGFKTTEMGVSLYLP